MIVALLLGCIPDDYDPNYRPPTDDVDAAIVGGWTSEGADLSDLFAGEPFNYVRVEADFRANGTYTVVVIDRDDQTATLVGTYTVGVRTDPQTVELSQSDPYAAFAEGIWEVTDGVLTYEVVQTVPDYGYTPPTPDSGFGTTTGPSLAAGANVQVYR